MRMKGMSLRYTGSMTMVPRSVCPCMAWSTCLMIPPAHVADQADQHNKTEHQVCVTTIHHGRLANGGTADSTRHPAYVRTAHTRQALQRAQNLPLPSRRIALPRGVRRRAALKRPRAASLVHGVNRSKSCVDEHASDGEDEDDDEDEKDETIKRFHMGDIDGLKIMLKHRIDELTMKPVRGMVTAWVKQLEPRYVSEYK
jgi:hypothetical protein